MNYELLTFQPSEALLADPAATLAPAIEFFKTLKGYRGMYFGPCEEDKSVGYMVIVWEAYENFKALTTTPGFPQITRLGPAVKSKPTILNVPFEESPETALTAGSTEVLLMTLKPGKTVEDLEAATVPFLAALAKVPVCRTPVAVGETEEEKGKYVAFVGWESTKAQTETISKSMDVYKPLIDGLNAVVDEKLAHAAFTKYD